MGFVASLAQRLLPTASAWRLGTSSGAEVIASTPIAKLSVSAMGGTFYMGMGANSIYIPYHYGGVGAGVGIGVSPPVTASFSRTEFWSTGGEIGRLYLVPGVINVADVDEDTLMGPAVVISPGVQFYITGVSISIIVFGATVNGLSLASPAALLSSAKAVAFQAGQNMTVGVSVGVEVQQINIFGKGRMVKM